MDDCYWSYLPEPVLAQIFSFLPLTDRENVNAVCRSWRESLDAPILWKRFTCSFYGPSDKRNLRYLQLYGHYVTHLIVELNQQRDFNRNNAVGLLKLIVEMEDIHLTHLSLCFREENPLFYAGTEFTSVLTDLLNKCGNREEFSRLTFLDFSGLQAKFTDSFVDCISTNCPNLSYLNILNKVIICNVTPLSVKRLAQLCRKLNTLHLYHTSFSDDVTEVFSEGNRAKLVRLGIVCRREQKYMQDISSAAWSQLVKSNPNLVVELGFDHTCPYHRIAEILKPEIPVAELHLITMTRLYSELNIVSSYYESVLEKLVVHTRPSKELDQALLRLAQSCKKLHTLCVYCVLDKALVEEILNLCPVMKKRKSFILKWELEPEPWTVGVEEGE